MENLKSGGKTRIYGGRTRICGVLTRIYGSKTVDPQNSAALTNVEIERYSRQLIIPEFNLDGEKIEE